MSIPPIPPPLEHLGNRPFSFYPPILNIEHNEWVFRKATWSEILVSNAKTAQDLWIPRRFMGEISRIEDPVVIVGLVKELEYKAGAVWPYQRRVIEMPIAVGAHAHVSGPRSDPAPIVGIRLEPGAETRIGRLIIGSLLVGVLACIGVVIASREGTLRPRVSYTSRDQTYLDLRYKDDYHSIVLKLGKPAEERWRENSGEIQYQALWYPQRSYFVILMGSERGKMGYIGTLDHDWKLLHSVQLPNAGDTSSVLRALKRF